MKILFSFRKKQMQPLKFQRNETKNKKKIIQFGLETALYHAPQLSFRECFVLALLEHNNSSNQYKCNVVFY